jgi:hypothetical protein
MQLDSITAFLLPNESKSIHSAQQSLSAVGILLAAHLRALRHN